MTKSPQGAASTTTVHEQPTMSFFDHLGELRRRLIYSTIAIALASAICYNYAHQIFELARWPLLGLHVQLTVFGPLDMFVTYIKLSLLCGLLIAAPVVLWQVWQFIAPGLYAHEKRWVVPFVVAGSMCFLGGAAFCFFVVLPGSFKYLVEMTPPEVLQNYSVELYFSLITQLMLAFGVVFELPLIMIILAAAGIVTSEAMARFRRYWIVIAAIIGAVLTPTPDPLTMMMMAVPLWVFFEIGIWGARLCERRRPRSLS